MKPLTTEQLELIYNLESHPLINETKIQHGNGVTRIRIESVVGAKLYGPDGIQALVIIDELGELFPGLEYFGTPAKHTNPMTGIEEELYFINFEGETLIWLVMQLGPEKWTYEDIIRREG